MTAKAYNVLFICTANSARSIMAESLMNHVARGRFIAHSAGSHPGGTVNRLALSTLKSMGLPTDALRSKNWDEFAQPDAAALDFVFTVCDNAAGEVCPVWPGQPMTAHWGLPDPAVVEGTPAQKAQAFMDAAITLRRRIDLMLSLPLSTLDGMALQQHMRDIGKR